MQRGFLIQESSMQIPTESIGSIPRPSYLLEAMAACARSEISQAELDLQYERATRETMEALEKTGSPVLSDGEQSKPSFVTYPLAGMQNLAPDGVVIPFDDGHSRQLPRLTAGPFRYQTYASAYLEKARSFTRLPVKQAVISPSALSLLYPQEGLPDYPREQFMNDLIAESAAEIRRCLELGAHSVQLDFTEGRLALKLDPSGGLLRSFIEIINKTLSGFSDLELQKIGVHTCPGGDHDSTHSAGVDYAELLPLLFQIRVRNFYMEYAGESDRVGVLKAVQEHSRPEQRIFLGVIDVIDPRVESAREVCDMLTEASGYIPAHRLGATDDCGFSPFADDISTARELAFAKIRARVEGVALAEKKLGG
jgi:5-methyltetrahydropteroyltriglutamate--homocysteine methyltransferase